MVESVPGVLFRSGWARGSTGASIESIEQKEKQAAGTQELIEEDQVKKEIEKELGNYVDDTDGSAGKSGAED